MDRSLESRGLSLPSLQNPLGEMPLRLLCVPDFTVKLHGEYSIEIGGHEVDGVDLGQIVLPGRFYGRIDPC